MYVCEQFELHQRLEACGLGLEMVYDLETINLMKKHAVNESQ